MEAKVLFKATDSLPRPEAKAAARWWADFLTKFKAKPLPKKTNQVTEDIERLERAKQIITPAKVKNFEEYLCEEIDRYLTKNKAGCSIFTDLWEHPALAEASKRAKLGPETVVAFPEYAYTNIEPGKVMTSIGTRRKPGPEQSLSL